MLSPHSTVPQQGILTSHETVTKPNVPRCAGRKPAPFLNAMDKRDYKTRHETKSYGELPHQSHGFSGSRCETSRQRMLPEANATLLHSILTLQTPLATNVAAPSMQCPLNRTSNAVQWQFAALYRRFRYLLSFNGPRVISQRMGFFYGMANNEGAIPV